MSKTFNALIIKWIAIFLATMIAFRWVANASWTMVFFLSFAATIANWLIGDLVILPSMGNLVASISDGVLGAVAALVFGGFSEHFLPSTLSLVVFGVVIAVFEFFFHVYLLSDDKVAP